MKFSAVLLCVVISIAFFFGGWVTSPTQQVPDGVELRAYVVSAYDDENGGPATTVTIDDDSSLWYNGNTFTVSQYSSFAHVGSYTTVLCNGEDLSLTDMKYLSWVLYAGAVAFALPPIWALVKILLVAVLLVTQRKR